MIRAGRLRHLVTFQVPLVEIDSNGDTTESWEDAFSGQQISAEIVPLSGRELIAAQQVHSRVSTRITVRYRPGILPQMRVLHRGTIYNIDAIVPDPDSGFRHATLLCYSGTNDG
jgi:SPP1 family predicted phage head-tail adaptor